MLGKLTRKEKSDGGLDFARANGLTLVVASKATGFGSDLLENVCNERVHDSHGFVGDTGIRVNLLEDLVNEGAVVIVVFLSHLRVSNSGRNDRQQDRQSSG